ncbi:MAG: leucine-rich repeat protein [Bacteroidales bacterium]|nr:leucine-rich repeat protein [Bacteroidales bacterium]
MHKKLFICIIAILTAFAAKAQLYYDENGNYVDLEDATDLSNGLTSLETGSYRIWFDNIEYTNLDINGDVKLYLCYNGVLKAEKITILSGSKLTIYDGEGSLTCQELNVNGTLNVIGGNITVNDEGITGSGNIIINGGQVTTSAIEANKLTIGWKKANDYFKADNFSVSSISIIDPQLFIVNNVEYKGELSAGEISSFVANIKGKELTPPSLQFDKDYILNHLPPVKQDLVYNGEKQELLDLTNYTFPTIEGGELLFSENGTDWVQNPTASRAYTHWITIKIQSQNESVYPSVILEKQLMVNIQSSETFDDEFFEYVVIDPNQKYVEISGRTYFAEFTDKLEIPSKVLHSGVYYTVTQIGESALNEMKNGSEGSPNVETIFFPNSIKRICKNAFIDNTALKSIELEDGTELTFIGETAFENCAFTNIEIPKQVTLGLNAFDNQFIDGNFNLTINWNQLSENSVLPCQKNDKYTRTLTIPPCASATDFESWGDVFEIKGGISSVSAETFDKLTFTKEYDKKAELSFDDNPITTINGNNLVITKIQLGELEEDRFFKESADAGKKVAKVSFNLLGNDNSKICPNDFDILLSQNEALIKPKDISEDIKALINNEKIYDQGRWATLTTGKAITTSTPVQDGFVNFVKLEDGIEFSFIQAEYNSKNASDASSIKINGSINNYNYSFPEEGITITEGVKITPKQLKVVANFPDNFSIVKDYDGTIQIPEDIKLSDLFSLSKQGIVNDDEVSIEKISAEYENATPGASKKIVFKITVSNSNYEVKDTAFDKGEIKATNIVVSEAGVTQVDTKEQYCAETYGNNIQLQFEVVEGQPLFYKIDDIPGISSDVKQVTEDDQQKDSYIINIGVMSDVKPGQYNGKIDFFADENGTFRQNEKPYEFTLTVYLPKNIVKQLYHNVIFVDNHDTLFTAYQWYKNDQPLKGETKQYITERPELTGIYSVEVTTQNGIKLHSCSTESFATTKLSSTVTPYPNPAKAGVPFTLKLIGGVPENASIMIFNNAGAQVMRIDNVNEYTTITLPRGFYSGALIYDGQKSGFKIIVE